MQKIKIIIGVAVVLGIFLWPVSGRTQTNLFVSPKGDDTNPGTKLKPFASVERALVEARKIRGAVRIRLFKGTYYLIKPVVLTAADSRGDDEPLVLTNAGDGKVVISGSTAITRLHWKKYKNGIWQTSVAQNIVFDQLFVNDELQRMARYPNYNPSARILGGTAADAISKKRVARWESPAGGYVHALHQSEWGDFHYLIKGKDSSGQLILEGGWQNNRPSGMHVNYRYAENIFEELDTVNEWYYNKQTKILYYFPPGDLNLEEGRFESPQLAHLFEFRGTEENPVKNITISGLTLTGTVRTFMQNREPLLRSDWTIYRGGAILLEGAVSCRIEDCDLVNLGNNAVFFSNYNRKCKVSGCLISRIGASGICFVGDPGAVRSPSFNYNDFIPPGQIDRITGPKSDNYPKNCTVYDNLLFDLGYEEKQSAGVELSMCADITVSHNSIYNVPRAGINVSEGTWGGHIIEYNDVFNTVLETGDHGSFNSWGRDRYWQPDKQKLDSVVAADPGIALLDAVEPVILRFNRFRCDHGWDIDLDDGSSNYLIYDNLCLNGGIKLREGVNRVVENNIMVNNTFHPHVWFKNSNDVFRGNVICAGYRPIGILYWGKEVDYNDFPDSVSLTEARNRGTDAHSVYGTPVFENPANGDFRLKSGARAFSVGFRNFSMDSFGVVSARLKTIAKKPLFPKFVLNDRHAGAEIIDFMGAKLKNLATLDERSATGMDAIRGVLVLSVAPRTIASAFLQPNDVILALGRRKIENLRDLEEASRLVNGTDTEIVLFRNQQQIKKRVKLRMQ